MSKTIVFIHGAWVTPLCWEKYTSFFESKGYRCIAPAWPCKDSPIEEQQKHPDPELAHLGITEIVDHYDRIIREMAEPPILIGHSFGGLFVQMLLDRGLGAMGIAIDSAPPKGVLPFYPSVIRSNLPILTTFSGWNKVLRTSFETFRYAFLHLLPENEQRPTYEKYVVPETGRIFFQATFALFNDLSKVNFRNARRAPLFLIAGAQDRICPAAQIGSNYNKYRKSGAHTDFQVFDNCCHWIIAQPGWEKVAGAAADWIERQSAAQ